MIPSTVTTIGSHAFYYCTSLKTILFAGESQLNTVGAWAFSETAITDITIPKNMINWGAGIFYKCKSLGSVRFEQSSSNYIISEYAFSGTAITSITIQSGVSSIGENAFSSCSQLTNVVFENTAGWKAGGVAVDSNALANASTAASYLTSTYKTSIWTRS